MRIVIRENLAINQWFESNTTLDVTTPQRILAFRPILWVQGTSIDVYLKSCVHYYRSTGENWSFITSRQETYIPI